MQAGEVERVLYNWIAEANSPIGQFPSDADRARWVSRNFLAWWSTQVRADYERVAILCNSLDRVLRDDLGLDRATEAGDEATDYLDDLGSALQALAASLPPAADAEGGSGAASSLPSLVVRNRGEATDGAQ